MLNNGIGSSGRAACQQHAGTRARPTTLGDTSARLNSSAAPSHGSGRRALWQAGGPRCDSTAWSSSRVGCGRRSAIAAAPLAPSPLNARACAACVLSAPLLEHTPDAILIEDEDGELIVALAYIPREVEGEGAPKAID